MEHKFIYVFDEKSKKELLAAGFELMFSNAEKSIFVFVANDKLSFALQNVKYVSSNMLRFA